MFGDAARVRHAACPSGSQNVAPSASCSTTPASTIAPSHSRTYRSFSPARAATPAAVAGGPPAIASNRPDRWPSDTMSAAAASLYIPISRPAICSALAIAPSHEKQGSAVGPSPTPLLLAAAPPVTDGAAAAARIASRPSE